MDNLLTIIIPTYNRCAVVDNCLERLYELNKKYVFDIIVCNNGSNDGTKDMLIKWEKRIINLKVINHDKNIFYDRNVASGYFEVDTDYCWVLGDSRTIDEQSLNEMLKTLEVSKPTMLVINSPDNNLSCEEVEYTDVNGLFRDWGWYMTLLCSCVIRRDFISEDRCRRYYDTEFEHEGLVFDYLSSMENPRVLIKPNIRTYSIPFKKDLSTVWGREPFKVFVRIWFSFIMSLPNKYTLEDKLYCIKQHERHQHLLSPSSIIRGRLSGVMTFKDYRPNRALMRFAVDYPLFVSDLISWLPPMPRLYKWLKSILKK